MTSLRSLDPATGDTVWEGAETTPAAANEAVVKARLAFQAWADRPVEARIAIARNFAAALQVHFESFAELISRETGKLLHESRGEVRAMIGKVELSIAAQAERAGRRETPTEFGRAILRHRAHGVMAVLGPYNFPGHLPNGHIVPALLAGNAVVFKPSELTPAVGERMVQLWREAELPDGLLHLVQGGRQVGAALLQCDIDGLLFTGSANAGAEFRRLFAERPNVILALELGGNNPLVAWDGDPEHVATLIAQSAFLTTGQRCSCARRLIVPKGPRGDAIIDAAVELARGLHSAEWTAPGANFMGPLISDEASDAALAHVSKLRATGARDLLSFSAIDGARRAFVTCGIIDTTGLAKGDEELFAPVLQICRVGNFDEAIAAANDTRFGLSAGLISPDDQLWDTFLKRIRAGVVNWNRPTTGALSSLPFGGLGESGNHRPSGFYASDYCAYPVSSLESDTIEAMPLT